ncbi:hypothetical protein DET65_0739 [Sunxiuqinia elliptica]|uniref:Uncharacterized protein n=1 Tax=Sunxiuqinia elliptica TaxID=655355 RepID=A0A4R6HAU1_9BACT|nr:hypothetical protein DET52_101182 [Sunxiuqinia elliptica]TDO64379.1 hypothetical protein DET65_0739 [Sunxiuqinia elliptica]
MLPVFRIEVESQPYQHRRGDNPEAYADHLVYTYHIENDEKHENAQQSACEDEQVLTFQSLKFHAFAYSFIDVIFHIDCL